MTRLKNYISCQFPGGGASLALVGGLLLRKIWDRPLLLTLFLSSEPKMGKALEAEGKIRWDQV